jgi:hypothetical protein
MRVLVTSARLPHALGVIRRLGEAGHEVYATDTFHTSPGLHSRHVKERILTASPRFETRTFVEQIVAAVESHAIDLVAPAFEEVFYLSRHLDELPHSERYFCSPLETLARVHNKRDFTELAGRLELPVGASVTVTSDAELVEATRRFDEFFGRAVFSRGGVQLLTNAGPLAGAVKIDEVHPTPEQPWVIQPFFRGEDLCSFSVAHHGEVASHCTYRHPLTIEHAGGIVFESVDDDDIVEITRRLVAHLGYHGHISFDWMRTEQGELHLVFFNDTATTEIYTMESVPYAVSLTEPDSVSPYVAAAGAREQIDSAIIRDMFREPRDIPEDLHLLLSGTRDVYAQKGDRLPGIYQVLSYAHVVSYRHRMHVRKHKHSDLMAAQFFDIEWDGAEID